MIAWFDCFAGASGDMILGALLDAGWEEGRLNELPALLRLDGVSLRCERVKRKGIAGIKVDVRVDGAQPLRTLASVQELVSGSTLPQGVKQKTLEIFHILGEAEAKVHGCALSHVHFHEIGAVDTILDIAGAVLALDDLGISGCSSYALPMGRGVVKCAHGILPVPAPAVAAILKDIPVFGLQTEGETVTPTGAAILKGVCQHFGPMPEMAVKSVGYGAGDAEFAGVPNLLRVWLGRAEIAASSPVTVMSTCIDDMNCELFPHVMARLFAAGALDVFVRPVYMKKGRPGHELVVLSPVGDEDRLARIVFQETSTSGMRIRREARFLLPRQGGEVMTPWGRVNVKVISRPDGVREIVPEFEECRRIAQEHDIPLKEVYNAVIKYAGQD